MAESFIGVELIGDATGVYRMLDHLDSCFSIIGMTRFFNGDVVPWLQQRAKSRFGSSGDDASGKWAPLLPATVSIRESGIRGGHWPGISPTHPINIRTHLMEDFITRGVGDISATNGNATLHFPRASVPTKSKLDVKVKRAQLGDSKTKKRPVLAVNEVDMVHVVQSLAYFIQRGPTV